MMGIFSPHLDTLQKSILATEVVDEAGAVCLCGSGNMADFRCRECFASRPSCQACIVQSHLHHPFHRIQKWNGQFFDPTNLHSLGYRLRLGHHGQPCPNRSQLSSRPGRLVVIAHINGFHTLNVEFCQCESSSTSPEFVQLMHAEMFPATIQRPETAFTFELLKNWHVHTLTSKKSGHDYHEALRRLTNAVSLTDVPV
jgi:hypothetical protein